MPVYCAMFLLKPACRRTHRFESRLHLRRIPLASAEQLCAGLETEPTERRPVFEAAARAKLVELIVFLSRAYTETGTTEATALLRVFRKATGQSPIDCLIRLRIQKSMTLLRDTDLTVTEIASDDQNVTAGTVLTASEEASKGVRFSKPNIPAQTAPGNFRMAVL
jgi:AraC-like DNA-binding protein